MPQNSAPPHAPPFTPLALALWQLAVVLAVVVPWLSPVTWGPNPAMVQTLLSGLGVVVLLVCWGTWGGQLAVQTVARTLAIAWALAALLSALAGLLQYFGLTHMLPAQWVNAADAGQAYANLRQRNQFASLTSLGLLAVLYLASETAGTGHAALRRTVVIWALLLLALGNAASSSRTGALQWGAILALGLLWDRTGPRTTLRWSALALLLYVLSTLLLPVALQIQTGVSSVNALERFQEHSGCEDRAILWNNVLQLIAQKPWLGWGWGELKFAHFIYPYSGARFCAILDNAHNLPLHLAVELGVPAAVLLCTACLGAVLWAQPWRERHAARQLAWAGLLVLGLHSLLEYPLWYGPFQMAVALCLLLLWMTRSKAKPVPGAPALALAAVLLPFLAYASWDYWRVGQLFLLPTQRAAAYHDNTMEKVRNSWLFHREVLFAEVTTSTPTPDTATALYAEALETLHFSPEPRVIDTLLESARLLKRDNEVTQRIRAQARIAYPAGQSPP